MYKYSTNMNKNTVARPSKADRQAVVLEVVRRARIATQHGLVDALLRRGVSATQASVSRDIAELGLVKAGGVYRSGLPEGGGVAPEFPIRAWARRATPTGPNLVVLHCETGTAQKVALALDQKHLPDVVGTVAGDDTIFVAVASRAAGRRVARLLTDWMTS